MNRQKGVSQVLALIIAAAVLMMAALTVIFMTQEGLTGTAQDKDRAQCMSTIQTQCGIGSNPRVPSVCDGMDIEETTDEAGNTVVDCTQY